MEKKITMSRRFLLVVFCFIFILAACAGPRPTATTSTATPVTPFRPITKTQTVPPGTPSLTPSPSPTATTGPAPAFVPSIYQMNVMLDYAAHTVSVDETITYLNSTGEELANLVLAVEPNQWEGCYLPGSLTVDGNEVSEFNLDGDRLEVPLATPLASGGTVNLFLRFDLDLPLADINQLFGYGEHQINLVDWYPFVVPYVPGQGWLLHPPAQVGEHLVYDPADFDITFHLTDPNSSAVIAASAPAEQTSFGWHYRLENARSFAFSISPDFQVATAAANGVSVSSYFFGSESVEGQAVLDNVVKALATYETLFGPNPYPSLSIVEAPFFDGMEYDGLFFLSNNFYTAYDGTVLNDLIDIAAHETAHQWWFGSVGNDQAMEPWLDEALATYSEQLFYEQNYPDVTAWEAYRIDTFKPTGWVDTDIYHGGSFRAYTDAVYLRGAQFLQTLRFLIGEEDFFNFLKDYATQMAGQRATGADFFRILRLHSSVDVSEIASAYFQQSY